MRIKKVETIPLHLPVKTPLVESGGTFSEFNHVLIKLHSDSGIVGLGEVEAYPSFERPGVETQEGILAIIGNYLAPCILDQDPFNLEKIWHRMDKAVDSYLRVKAGIDIALYDLLGKMLGIPVYCLLGGCVREEYIVEGVGYGISIDEPERVARIAKDAVNHGYKTLELKAGDENPEMDVERVRAVREAIGKNIPLKIDFNGYYDVKTAIMIIEEMEQFGISWVEQPVKYWDIEGLAMVRNSVKTKVSVDEAVESPQELMRVVKLRAADGVHIKPQIKGGLSTAKKLRTIAEAADMVIIPGTSAATGLGIGAAQAFIASTRHIYPGMHGSPVDILVEDIVLDPIPANSTRVKISHRPGLGVELNETVVNKYRAS
jgi:L-alanine-DL-glutamate epimerase-like enolase superfamily enzyme